MRFELKKNVASLLKQPGFGWIAVFLGMALALPSLTGGLASDDHLHRMAVNGHPRIPEAPFSPFSLFSFTLDESWLQQDVMDRLVGVWGIHEDLKIAFMRPSSSDRV